MIIEGGTTTLETFIEAKYWDEARVFKSSIKLEKGIKAPFFENNSTSIKLKNDNLTLFQSYD